MKPSVMKCLAPIMMLAAAVGCGGSDSTGTQSSALAGSYTAVQWVTTGNSGQTPQLAIGSTLQITLNNDGSTTGHMHLAASGGNTAMDFDMAGTWAQNGNNVSFSQAADTFLRNMVFTIQPIATGVWDLVGVYDTPGTRVELTLRRAP